MTTKLDKHREKYLKHVSIPCGTTAHADHIQISQELKEINPSYRDEYMDDCRNALEEVRAEWKARLANKAS